MARTVRDSKLDSRTAREKLRPRGKPYFRLLGPNLHLGYRKGQHGGKWVMRRYVGDEKYVVETIGAADDLADADGAGVSDVRSGPGQGARAREGARRAGADCEPRPDHHGTRRDRAIPGRARRTRGEVSRRQEEAGRALEAYQTCPGRREKLAAKPLAVLTTGDLAKWREGLEMAAGSAQRTTNDFRAALYAAAKSAKAALPATIRDTIADGLAKVDATSSVAREAQILPDADVRALIAAAWQVDAEGDWGGDLGRLVLVLAATGARFGQVARMTVANVLPAQNRLMVPTSRKGKGEKPTTHIGVRVGDDVLAALAKATAGRKGSEVLLLRPRWQPVASCVGRRASVARGVPPTK